MRFAENIRIFSSQDGNNKYAVRIFFIIELVWGRIHQYLATILSHNGGGGEYFKNLLASFKSEDNQ